MVLDLLKYSVKTLLRNPSRNFFVVFIVTLMSVFTVFSASLFEGKNQEIENSIVKAHTGRWQIQDKNMALRSRTYPATALTVELKKILSSIPYSSELLLESTLLHNKGAQALTLVGIDEGHEKVFPLVPKLVQGRFLDLKEPLEVVVGEKFFNKYGLELGENILVTYQDQGKSLLSEALKVVGVYKDFGPAFEERTVFLPKAGVLKLMGLSDPNLFHRIVILDKKKPRVQETKSYFLKNWQELRPELHALMKFHEGVTNFMVLFMLAVAFVSIVTPVHLLWDARAIEIKMLTTLGIGKRPLYMIGTFESVVLAIISATLALSLSALLIFWLGNTGIDLAFMGQTENVRTGILIPTVVYPTLKTKHVVLILCFNVSTIFLSNIWCLRKKVKETHYV